MFSGMERWPADRFHLPPEATREVAAPALVVFMDHVRDNITQALHVVGGDVRRWRPHLKTTKMPLVWDELLRTGLRSFKCATTREARVLLEETAARDLPGVDLLVAYPHRDLALRRLGDLARAHPRARVSVICEDEAIARSAPPELGLFVDVNVGMHRTGVPIESRDEIVRIARAAGAASGGRFRGIHAYEGHIRGGTIDDRRARTHAALDQVARLADDLVAAGMSVGEVITSGTPTLAHAATSSCWTRAGGPFFSASAGTVVFHDFGYHDMLPELSFTPAALVLTRVISRPAPNIATCDAGSKSIAAESGDPCAVVIGRSDLAALKPSEEHLPLEVRGRAAPQRGDLLLLVPRHVCPTVNLHEEAIIIDGGRFAGLAPISARGRERPLATG